MRRRALASAAMLSASAALVTCAVLVSVASPRAAARARIGHAPAATYAEGAPPGFSGGFGEQSCHACHFHADVNAGPGRVTIEGVPERFVAGQRYPITITLARPEMQLGGFQLTARFKEDGAQAGTLAPAAGDEERLALESQGDIQYANQRHAGTTPSQRGVARWSLVWTAPPSSGTVVFNVSANAANADGTVEGDYVHTAAVDSRGTAHR